MTADDVVWSMNRHLGSETKSAAKALMAPVKEWRKVGPYEVKAICEAPYSDLATVLGEKHLKIAKADTTDFANAPGTGPYKLESFRPGIGSTHVRNEDYWREGGNFDRIEMLGATDPIARVNALISGDVDMVTNVDPKAIPQVEGQDGVEIISTPAGSYMGIAMHAQMSPGDNADFVLAMKYLMQRERIVSTLLKGHGTAGNDQPINSAYGVDYCQELALREFDPDRAKSLLAKSGITSAELVAGEVAGGATDVAILLQRECAKIGFDLQVKKVPTDGYWGAVWQKVPMCMTAWNMRPTASIMLDIAYSPSSSWSDMFWKNDQMVDLLAKVKAETDPANKHEILCQMQRIVHDTAPVAIPAFRNQIDGAASRVKGMPRLPLGPLGGSEWPEFAWLDA